MTLDYAEGVLGTSTITVTATDSGGESIETSFTASLVETINETPLNINDDIVTTDEDTSITILASELLNNDEGDNLSITEVTMQLMEL